MNSIALSTFFVTTQAKSSGTRCLLPLPELIPLIQSHWDNREPGYGRQDLDAVVVVPLQELTEAQRSQFVCGWGRIEEASDFQSKVTTRSEGEDTYVETTAIGPALPSTSIQVVLYSAAALEENGGSRSSQADWEVVALLVSPWANAPMEPLTMARNFLHKPGGTFAPYTAEEFAHSIYFWSQYVKLR
jgi:hypothetical protein